MRPQTDKHTDTVEHYTFRAVYTTHAKCSKYTDIFKKQISVIFHHLYLLKNFTSIVHKCKEFFTYPTKLLAVQRAILRIFVIDRLRLRLKTDRSRIRHFQSPAPC